jgi:hypothetical protein
MANPISGIDEAGDAVRGVIRAYHGSPYDFDKFDASKIGDATGTQMAGHGIYFAENERVASRYRYPLRGRLPESASRHRGKLPGRVYEVDIMHPHERLIDFETPLSQQAEIEQAMHGALGALPKRDAKLFEKFLAEDPDGHGAYMLLDHLLGPEKAAAAMQGRGVPGTRFLDATGEGTRNYVMFPGTEDSIRILRKYGLLAPVTAGAMQEER